MTFEYLNKTLQCGKFLNAHQEKNVLNFKNLLEKITNLSLKNILSHLLICGFCGTKPNVSQHTHYLVLKYDGITFFFNIVFIRKFLDVNIEINSRFISFNMSKTTLNLNI